MVWGITFHIMLIDAIYICSFSMASPTPVTYNFKDFEEEINKIGTNDSKKILSELKAYLEVRGSWTVFYNSFTMMD